MQTGTTHISHSHSGGSSVEKQQLSPLPLPKRQEIVLKLENSSLSSDAFFILVLGQLP